MEFVKRNRICALEALVFLFAFAVALWSISVDFYLDDFELLFLAKRYVQDPFTIPTVFLRGNTQAGYYRPVMALFWIVGYSIWKDNPKGFQILLGILTVVGVVYLYRIAKFLQDRISGMIACLLFVSFFPTIALLSWKAASSVWITSFSLVTIGVFYFLTWVEKRGTRTLHALVSWLALTGAYLSNEASVVAVPILCCYILLDWHKKEHSLSRLSRAKQVIFLLSLSVVFPLILMASRLALGGMINPSMIIEPSVVARNIQFYVTDYYLKYLTIFLIIPVFLATILRRSMKHLFALLWAGIGLTPALLMDHTAYRWVLFTTAGVALLFGFAVSDYVNELREAFRKKSKRTLRALISLAMIGLVCLGTLQIALMDMKYGSEIVEQETTVSSSLSTTIGFLSQNLPKSSVIYFERLEGMHFDFQLDMALDLHDRDDINVRPLGEITALLKAEMIRSFVVTEVNRSQSFKPYWSMSENSFAGYVFKADDVASEINFAGLTLSNKEFYDLAPNGRLAVFIAAHEFIEIEYLDYSGKNLPNRDLMIYVNDCFVGEIAISNSSGEWKHSVFQLPQSLSEKEILRLEFANPVTVQPFAISSVRSLDQS